MQISVTLDLYLKTARCWVGHVARGLCMSQVFISKYRSFKRKGYNGELRDCLGA